MNGNWDGWAVQPTDEARAAVLAEYRKQRRNPRSTSSGRPHDAMREVMVELSMSLAMGFAYGHTVTANDLFRGQAEQLLATYDYSRLISERSHAQAERRGLPWGHVFWFHGRIGGVS